MNDLTHVDLFSGIGGFALAARWAGIKTVQFVEIDKFCQKVLRKNFPGVPIHDDIKTFTNTDLPQNDATQNINGRGKSVTNNGTEVQSFNSASSGTNHPFLLTGGFPCQPFSCAGKRKGTEDDRHLWPEMLRVIKEFKPTWIIGENVAGIRSMELVNSDSAVESNPDIQEDGENDYTTVLDGICNDLEGIGYEVQPIIIPACAVGAPHRRDRVWIVGRSIVDDTEGRGCGFLHSEDIRKAAGEINASADADRHAPDTGCFGQTEQEQQAAGSKQCDFNDTNTTSERLCGDSSREEFFNETSGTSKRVGFSREDWNKNWIEVATRLCRVDDGLPRQVDRVKRLKALGNAIVPQVAAEIMKAILQAENEA